MKLYYTTFPDEGELARVSGLLLDERLSACVNSFPIVSLYWWEGEKEEEGEIGALFKTSEDKAEQFVARLEQEHPYEVPEILELQVSANASYESWVEEETEEGETE